MNDAGIRAVTGRLPRGKGRFRGIFNPHKTTVTGPRPVYAGVKYQPGIETFLVSFLEALRGVVLINGVRRTPLQSNDSLLDEILIACPYEAQLRNPRVP